MEQAQSDEHEVAAVTMAKRLVGRFSGETSERVRDKPSRFLFIRTLGPKFDPGNPRYRWAPPAEMGMEFLVPTSFIPSAHLVVRANAAFYYRVFPTLEEQRLGVAAPPTPEEEEDDEETEPQVVGTTAELAVIFQKIGPLTVECSIPLSSLANGSLGREASLPGGGELATRALEVLDADERARYHALGGRPETMAARQQMQLVPPEAMRDQGTFNQHVRATWTGRAPEPEWATGVFAKAEEYDELTLRVSVILRNLAEEDRPRDDVDNGLYETRLEVGIDGGQVQPFVLDELRDDYRFDGRVPGKGVNCTVAKQGAELVTEHAPIFKQRRFRARLFDGAGASLAELAANPMPALRDLLSAMRGALASMEATLVAEGPKHGQIWRKRFEEDVAGFRQDVERVQAALTVLSEVPEALEAFKLMNRTFSISKSPFTFWRRFQVIFALLQLPDAVAVYRPVPKSYRDVVDVIYFPTGGGKTEAYLAAVVFQMFLDRLMGKRGGVTAITKFPLRLLSLQQLQRISDVFGAAEAIRRDHALIGAEGYDPFSTGYFVGQGNTPNRLLKTGYAGEEGEDNLRPVEEHAPESEGWRIIPECPFPGCGGEVQLEADRPRVRIIHRCKKCGNEVPVYVSDDEVYRYLPTLVVSTLDKCASAGLQRNFRQLFGVVDGWCKDHGYFSGGACMYYEGGRGPCKRTDHEKPNLVDPTPSLLIQDEIHLVRESLGTYDSHYETFMDILQRSITEGRKRIKVLAASATISQFQRQLRHLYLRDGARFPSHGPNVKDSFYAREDPDVARVIVGILPRITPIFSILWLIQGHRELLAGRRAPSLPGGTGIIGDYSLALCYNLKKMAADEVANSVRRQVNAGLVAGGVDEIEPDVLSGDVGFGAVRDLLHRVEDPDLAKRPRLIISTSAISHGVDLDALNVMVFHGMPSNTAEYVQAYSRVGRKFTGVVFVVFNPFRERDMSHYQSFGKYHEVTDMLVEPVPINRWAKFSVLRTVPGIFAASVLNYFEPAAQRKGVRRLYMMRDFAQALNRGDVDEDALIDFVKRAYGVAAAAEGTQFARVIEERVSTYIAVARKWTAGDRDGYLPFSLPDQPMSSLRDTDIPVEISAEPESLMAMRLMKGA